MTRDEQSRQRLVEIALLHAQAWSGELDPQERDQERYEARELAGFKDASKGSWCAAGLTAAMEDAGLLVPAPGTPARRGAVALLDWVIEHSGDNEFLRLTGRSGAVKQKFLDSHMHAGLLSPGDIIAWLQHPAPDPAGWRRGHVAVIVKVDTESLTTVGWNEGASPGRVMMRRLWRDTYRNIVKPNGDVGFPKPQDTVLWRRPGLLYGIARPVAA